MISPHVYLVSERLGDLQLYTAVRSDSSDDLTALEGCMAEVWGWFLRNGLLLNPMKTEAIVFGTCQRLSRNPTRYNSITVTDATVNVAQALKILGVTLDSALTFDKHVSDVVWACKYHLRAL